MLDPRILALILFAGGLSIARRRALEARDPVPYVMWMMGMYPITGVTLNFLLTSNGRQFHTGSREGGQVSLYIPSDGSKA